ncbi:hypothetical protein STRIP9103_01662 [Streptomyces ipomoeae 91-03]|uniref:Uncharacterized protein n=1 Tax=Streptomyces ipomoeae 91-03 TaxID=698759 RepID=L1KQW3_9ACTN|nr:hypothetical protein STRIP9103_01662 [Streptomyces ipomoeae 91-03]
MLLGGGGLSTAGRWVVCAHPFRPAERLPTHHRRGFEVHGGVAVDTPPGGL